MDQNRTPGTTPEASSGTPENPISSAYPIDTTDSTNTMDSMNTMEQPSNGGNWKAPEQKKKRDNRLPIVAGLVGGLAVALIAALLFVTGTVGASPAKKYEKLQKKWLDRLLETHDSGKAKGDAASVGSDQAVDNLAKSYTIRLSLTEECKSLLGMDIIDQVDLNGDMFYNRISRDACLTGALNLNGTNLFQFDAVMDTAYQIAFARIPQLCEEYLSMDIMDYMEEEGYTSIAPGEYGNFLDSQVNPSSAMPPELVEELLVGLKDIWTAHAPKTVALQKNCQKEIGGVSAKVDLYEASWTELELTDCLLEMVRWLQGQKELENYMIGSTGMEIAEYRSTLNEMIKMLEQSKEVLTLEESQEKLLTIRLGGGREAGCVEFELPEMGHPLFQAIWSEGKGGKAEGYFQAMADSDERVAFHMSAEPDGDGRKGVVTFEVANGGETTSAELTYDGYRKEKDGSFHCHAVLNSEAFQGIGVGATVDTTAEKQSLAIELLMGNLSLGELEFSVSDRAYEEFEMPNQSYEITDEEQVMDYLELCDLEGFLSRILENPDVEQMIQLFFGESVNGTMMKEAVLENIQDRLGWTDDDPFDEDIDHDTSDTDDGDQQTGWRDMDPDADFSGFTGYHKDDDGWVSFEPVWEEVLAAGQPSTGYTSFPGKKLSEMKPEFQKLAEEAYGDQIKEGEPYESNQIYGYEPYVASYYTRRIDWYVPSGDYDSYLSVAADSVNEEIQSIEIGDADLERGCALAGKAVAAVCGVEASEVEEALKQSIEEEDDYVSVGDAGIFWYQMTDDYITISVYPIQ